MSVLRYDAEGRAIRGRLPAEPGWLYIEEVARRMNVSIQTAQDDTHLLAQVVSRKHPANAKTRRSFRGVGALWNESEIDELISIKHECRLTLQQACRVLRARQEGRL